MRTSPEITSAAKPAQLMQAYGPTSGTFDECATERGVARPHWNKFIKAFERLGTEELAARWENGKRILREHGVTYNVYGDPQGIDRPWELDMVPLVIDPEEWARVEAGLAQRARLLNAILADVYGPQRLLREGVLPPPLVFGNPAFLRPCHGIRPPGNIYLHLQAVDLARSPDGQWWALTDRTQAPSGTGYALENRIVLSRILPDEFRDCNVQRLASFFSVKRDTLRSLAPGNPDNPSVVLLTPGPHNETYFEHVYLARYLGFTLVEGGDLTVRDRRVFVKMLEGLQPVDVILRRVDDTFCDPLELRSDSFLGVPGLVEAARAGNVTIANALGSGLVESPAMLAFLPTLCRYLLDEELKLPSVATWWCGQAKEQEYVLENLDKMVLKPSFGPHVRRPIFGGRLTKLERENLVNSIRTRPLDFIGQEQVALSTAPIWSNQKLEPRRVVLRAYITAHGDSFTVMPGGLTRVAVLSNDPVVSMQTGGGSKDTWVLSGGPVAPVTLLTPTGQPTNVVRMPGELPSRVADNLFWIGRYVERLEGRLRLLRCVLTRMIDEAGNETSAELSALIHVLVGLGIIPERFTGRVALKALQQEILQLVYSPDRVGSVRELTLRLRQITAIVRDRFSSDTWRILHQLQIDLRSRPGRIPLVDALALLNTLITDISAFSGMEMENMTRGHGWRFLDFGRRLERASNLVNVVQASVAGQADPAVLLEPLLEFADSSMTYRRRYFARAELASVLELLLRDERNPRSLAFQFQALTEHAANLPRHPRAPEILAEQKRLAGLTEVLRQPDLPALARARETGERSELSDWLGSFQNGLAALSDELTHFYFTLTVARSS